MQARVHYLDFDGFTATGFDGFVVTDFFHSKMCDFDHREHKAVACPLHDRVGLSSLLQVRATGGDTRLGGEDFDVATARFLEMQFLRSHPSATIDGRARRRLAAAAERAKRHLSSHTTAEV